MATISVQYPAAPGSHFDLDYYMKTHMPLVEDRFAAFGFQGFQVLRGVGAPGGEATYQVTALLSFPAVQNFVDAIGKHGGEVMGDIPNFTDIQPIIQFNEEVPKAG